MSSNPAPQRNGLLVAVSDAGISHSVRSRDGYIHCYEATPARPILDAGLPSSQPRHSQTSCPPRQLKMLVSWRLSWQRRRPRKHHPLCEVVGWQSTVPRPAIKHWLPVRPTQLTTGRIFYKIDDGSCCHLSKQPDKESHLRLASAATTPAQSASTRRTADPSSKPRRDAQSSMHLAAFGVAQHACKAGPGHSDIAAGLGARQDIP